MKSEKIIKNLIIISYIMIAIYMGGLIYQFITHATALAKVIKITDIIMFLIFIFTLKKKGPVAPIIGLIIAMVNFVISIIYLDFISIVICILIAYECILLVKEWQKAGKFPTHFQGTQKKETKISEKRKTKTPKE